MFEIFQDPVAIEETEKYVTGLPLKIDRMEYRIIKVCMDEQMTVVTLYRFTTWADVSDQVLKNLQKKDLISRVYFSHHLDATTIIDESLDTPFNMIPDLACIYVSLSMMKYTSKL